MMNKEQSFEKAFERLEEILKNLNEGKISLDESLKLFEEADALINNCSVKLSGAEQKIEKLIKNREKLELDEEERPKKELFITKEDNELPSFR